MWDIFISYRRKGSQNLERLIRDRLTSLGYSVFLDIESLRSGKFNEQLYTVIEECSDVILILPPHALDRCVNDDDWVRNEIRCALQKGKNIIPIMMSGFNWDDVDLPSDIEEVRNCQGICPDMVFFDAVIEKLCTYLKSRNDKTEIFQLTTIKQYTEMPNEEAHDSKWIKERAENIIWSVLKDVFLGMIGCVIWGVFAVAAWCVRIALSPEKWELPIDSFFILSDFDICVYCVIAFIFGVLYGIYKDFKRFEKDTPEKSYSERKSSCSSKNITAEMICYDDFETFSHKLYALFSLKSKVINSLNPDLHKVYSNIKHGRMIGKQVIIGSNDGSHVDFFQVIPIYKNGTIFFLSNDLKIKEIQSIMREQDFILIPSEDNNVLTYRKFNLFVQIVLDQDILSHVTVIHA